jgi:hypothetical protein
MPVARGWHEQDRRADARITALDELVRATSTRSEKTAAE